MVGIYQCEVLNNEGSSGCTEPVTTAHLPAQSPSFTQAHEVDKNVGRCHALWFPLDNKLSDTKKNGLSELFL